MNCCIIAVGGVAVLPAHPQMAGPLSPRSLQSKEDTVSVFSNDDQDDKGKINKKRKTRRGEKDKENHPVEIQKCWNVEKTSKWQYPEEFVIKENWELLELDKFMNEKVQKCLCLQS